MLQRFLCSALGLIGASFVEILAADPRSLSEMLADVPATSTTPELRVDCPDALKLEFVRRVTEQFRAAGHAVIDLDGARIAFASATDAPAWGLVRASNTGPVLVMRVEAGSEAELGRIHGELERAVAAARADAERR
jgi:phosphomannomutase/phosphoglucomutase